MLVLEAGEVAFRPSREPEGTVLEQDPEAGSQVPAGTAVNMVAAQPVEEERRVPVPELRGLEVPEAEELASLAKHQATMAIYLSISLVDKVAAALKDAYGENATCAIAFCVSQPEEKIIFTTLDQLAQTVKQENITRQALILVGRVLDVSPNSLKHQSMLYNKNFSHGYRK